MQKLELDIDVKHLFSQSELCTGKLITEITETELMNNSSKIKNIQISELPNILYRFTFNDGILYFLLYDFKTMFISKQSISEITDLNKEINPSLEFNDFQSLLGFLIENMFQCESNVSVFKINDNFHFEVLVNIIKVKWIFSCEKYDIKHNSNYSIIQDFFVKPMINILFSFGNVLTDQKKTQNSLKNEVYLSDMELLVGNMYVNRQKNFDKNILKLSQESTKKINYQEVKKDGNLKRKLSNVSPNKAKQARTKKDPSLDRDKSSEKTSSDIEKPASRFNQGAEKKKKGKLKFV